MRGPLVTKESDIQAIKSIPGIQELLTQGHKVLVLAIGKARLFYEGNPVVFGGAVDAVLGDPAAGDVVSVTDHAGKVRDINLKT